MGSSSSQSPVSSITSSQAPPSYPPPNTVENNNLLEKYHPEIEVHAWNNYMPHYGASTTPYPDPILIVRFTSPQNEPIPSITVWVKIAGSSTPFDAMLTCDGNSPAYHFETFRAGAERGLKLDSMILPVTVTFVIGEEYQTIPFELRVGVTH